MHELGWHLGNAEQFESKRGLNEIKAISGFSNLCFKTIGETLTWGLGKHLNSFLNWKKKKFFNF